MEDYYERYIDKEPIINNACACIEANRSSKLLSEIRLVAKYYQLFSLNFQL